MDVGRRRVRALLTAGLLDSFGLSLGWTAFILIAVGRGGLPAAGLYNAAMLAGVVCSAPVTAWFASRVDGRTLLGSAGSVELVLRVGTLAGLLLGWSPALLAAGVAAMNVAAWTGYAGMRAEVAAVDPGTRSLTHYAVAIAAVEAIGAGVAALLPITAAGRLGGGITVGILLIYGSSVAPQFLCARTSMVRSGRDQRDQQTSPAATAAPAELPAAPDAQPASALALASVPALGSAPAVPALASAPALGSAPAVPAPASVSAPEFLVAGSERPTAAVRGYLGQHRRRRPVALPMPFGRQPTALVGGALIMLIASGPVTLGTALAQQLYGHAAVGFAAMAFSVGCLLASPAAAGLARLAVPSHFRWILWGAGMLLGWLIAPWQLAGLLAAQLLSALALTAFQGEMDATVAEAADASRVTSALAWSAAVRAGGSAVAVRMLPVLIAAPSIGVLSAAATVVLLGGALIVLAVARLYALGRRAAEPSPAEPSEGKPGAAKPRAAEPCAPAVLIALHVPAVPASVSVPASPRYASIDTAV
jgi:hypothetical protein